MTAGVHEVKATREGLGDNCGGVTEKVMEQGRYEKEPRRRGRSERRRGHLQRGKRWSERSSSSTEELDKWINLTRAVENIIFSVEYKRIFIQDVMTALV